MTASLYDSYRNLAMTEPKPTLERTSGEIRDRAVNEARDAEGDVAELREGLRLMTEHYVALANCGDCGIWDPEKEPIVIQTRALLTKVQK